VTAADIRLLDDSVLIKLIPHERAIGRITIPDEYQERPQEEKFTREAIVVAVGPGLYSKRGIRKPVPVKPGDRVIFEKFGFNDIVTADGEKLSYTNGRHILGVIG
jgi:chaperonin GroES